MTQYSVLGHTGEDRRIRCGRSIKDNSLLTVVQPGLDVFVDSSCRSIMSKFVKESAVLHCVKGLAKVEYLQVGGLPFISLRNKSSTVLNNCVSRE